MPLKQTILKTFDFLATLAMRVRPVFTVWAGEKAFLVAPERMRKVVERFASQRILACVVGGELPMLPDLNGGDAVLFYPLPQCDRYELLEHPELTPKAHFGGQILVFTIPPEKRRQSYNICAYDAPGTCYSSGSLASHGDKGGTKLSKAGIETGPRGIRWRTPARRYLASFVMVHTNFAPHAAVYSHRGSWPYPQTRHLPHVVIPPDEVDLTKKDLGIFVMIVEYDAWVPEILVWAESME